MVHIRQFNRKFVWKPNLIFLLGSGIYVTVSDFN